MLNLYIDPHLSWWQRIKLLFTGVYAYDFLFCSEEQIQDYIDALQESLDHLKTFDKDKK